MRQIILYIGMSLDGYIADRRGQVDFLKGYSEEDSGDSGYGEWIETVDTVVMGMNTYRQIVTELSPGCWPYPGKKCYVFSRREQPFDHNVTFVQDHLEEWIQERKQEAGKSIWICGGAQIAGQLIREDLIDIYDINIVPVILGGGIPLFPQREKALFLKLDNYSSENGIIRLIYRHR